MDLRPSRSLGIALLLALPASAQNAELLGNDTSTQDRFGRDVGVSGNTIIVGSNSDTVGLNSGSAYVFVSNGSSWSQQAQLFTDLPSGAGDNFGIGVSVDAETAVVGAMYEDNGKVPNAGAAYVFQRSGSSWSLQQKLHPDDPISFQEFGQATSISGDTALVGAPQNSRELSFSGAVYVFRRRGSAWTQEAKLTPPDRSFIGLFGFACDVSGDTAVVGEYAYDGDVQDMGRVHVFVRSGATWTLQQTLERTTPELADNLGFDVDVAGDVLVAGTREGRALIFERSGGAWSLVAELTSPDGGSPEDKFGINVGTDGQTIAIGARRYPAFSGARGAVYLYRRVAGSWTYERKVQIPGAGGGDEFGDAVSVDGGVVVGGAPRRDVAGSDAGSIYVDGTPSTEPGFGQCYGVGCPCGNDDPSAGCANSTGSGASLAASGSNSVAADDLVLTATNLPPNQSGLFYMGNELVQAPFYDGFQCALGDTIRFLNQIQSSGPSGTMTLNDVVAESFGLITPGSTWHWHCWHRDVPMSPCGTFANLSNLYTVTFVP